MRRSYTVWPWLSVSAVIAVLIGAGTSFAPLYLDNWVGDARHYMCPMIGGHDVDDSRVDAGLCVTPLAWFVIVTALCLLLAVVFAVYCEMAMHVDAAGGLHGGGVMTLSARRARNAALWTLPAFLVVGLALGILTAAAWLPLVWLVAFFAVWLQAGWHVCDRIGLRLTTRTANDTLAAIWGFGVALTTHALVCYHVTFIGGIRGAALSACCSWAIASVSYNGDAVGEAAAADRRIATARGVIASIIQWVMVYNAVRAGESASNQTTATWLCPQFSVTASGARVGSCSPEGLRPLLSSVGLVLMVATLLASVCAAMACHFGRRSVSRGLYAAAGLCAASAFVIGTVVA